MTSTQSLPHLPILPYELYGEAHLPVVVVFSCSSLPPTKAFNLSFIEDLAESYRVILLSLPCLSEIKDSEHCLGYSCVELMTMLYRTFLHFNLLPELQNINEEVEEKLRRLSTADEEAILESTPFLRTKSFEGISSSPAKTAFVKEERKDALSAPPTVDLCNVPKTKFYPRRCQDSLILDDVDILEETKELAASDSSSLFATPAKVNIFNQEEIKQKNEEILRELWSRTNSMENLLLPEERPFQPALKSPAKRTAQASSPFLKLSSRIETYPNRLHAVIGQDCFSNYLLMLYQNQFPDHFSHLILMNYGMKNSFFLSDFFMILPWESFLVICLLSHVILKFSWINFFFSIVIHIIVFIHEVIEWISFLYWCIQDIFQASSSVSSKTEIEYLKRRWKEFNHWKEEMFTYKLNENVWIYYQLWRMRIAGSALTPRDPIQCSIYFMYEKRKTNFHQFDHDFVALLSNRSYCKVEDLASTTPFPSLIEGYNRWTTWNTSCLTYSYDAIPKKIKQFLN